MGRGIIYCATCGSRILEQDFDSKAAFRLDSRGFCKKCAPEALKSLPPEKMAEALSQISQAESSASRKALPAARPHPPAPAPTPGTRRRTVEPSKTPIVVGSVVVGVLVILVLAVVLSGSEAPPAPTPRPPVTPDRPAKPDRETLALQALQKAREFREANPKDVATQTNSFQRVVDDYRGTRAAGDAQRDLEDIRRRGTEALESELRALQEQARGTSTGEEFQKAIQTLTDARGKHAEPTWTQGIDQAVAEIRALAEKLYPAVKSAAVEARRQGAAAGVQEAKDRLARWGLAQYTVDLEAALAAVPLSEKRPLFNGKDLSGWYVTRGKWGYKDAIPQSIELDENQRTFIATVEELKDFELEGWLETSLKTYLEFNARGGDRTVAMHLETGWHKFRVVAAGQDVKFFVDDKPVGLSGSTTLKGQFGIFSLGSIRLKDVMIRP